MAVVSKTRIMLEGFMREGSFKWLTKSKNAYDDEIEEMERSPSAKRNWLVELSPVANVVVWRCSKILGISMFHLKEQFDEAASESLKHPSQYARNLLEYWCFRVIAFSIQKTGFLDDKKFRRLTFDTMVAWEFPAAASQPVLNMEEDVSVSLEAFCRIAPAVPIIADVIVSQKLFEVLTLASGGRLQFSVYDKYLSALERAIKKQKSLSESSVLFNLRSARGEKILEVDGTVTSQPVLEHVGISTWPGRLTLTDHALYFEAHRVVSFEKAKVYDLSDDLKQIVRPELTGPLGTRLFDKAVMYKAISISEPVILEFPELKGHSRRDYWLSIIREVLYVHRFIDKFHITGIHRDEYLLKAIFGILRVQALKEIITVSFSFESLLMFNICDQLPGGDHILETLANMSTMRPLAQSNSPRARGGMYSVPTSAIASPLGFMFGTSSTPSEGLLVGDIAVGEMTALEKAVLESRSSYKKMVHAQASVDGVKVDGIDTNVAVMMELLYPLIKFGNLLQSLASWEDPLKSMAFCTFFSFIIWREWLSYTMALLFILSAVLMIVNCFIGRDSGVADELKVVAPPAMNAMEQLLAVQNAISQAEELIQDANVILLKSRALLLAIFPQASKEFAVALVGIGLVLGFMPVKYLVFMAFVEIFTRNSPLRRASTERWTRRLREWWFSVPAAPVLLERSKEDKKKR